MSKVRQHHEYAETGKPSQDSDTPTGTDPPKTNFDGTNGRRDDSPHREEKSKD